ncbi:16S rRNA (guanine(966)-N(2))-methyltransferase RsmD [Aquihabitans sp. McL0605]|uniref:16S rRNA (guanine(966)-N(2))-methyltransferase RsmD n=1 Tax=Aquihabitans sp. McL0605 TaxID=3415671 RepID=UPI003CE7B75D
MVAGSAGGRRIDVPPGTTTRPTSDRVREALFNALDSLDVVEDRQVLDGFAGSGALGIEALSRGAAHATFVDTDPVAVRVVEANLGSLGLDRRATVLTRALDRALAVGGSFDLVLLDPPYAYDEWDDLFELLAPTLSPDAVVVVESDREIPLPPGLAGIRSKTYGGTVVQFASPSGAPS